ncbi:hypothetical protein HYALB_00008935 [Hymenoscyphus albidus]|uniref:Uncharacterized protein n=1 Tax=Hymenoscyphus albidus TaxID=595503 RepID=A0A9N9LGP7_9HELO|nr:hypothetical protein HYALB_00008935 [Hymenoscyphus albidus]
MQINMIIEGKTLICGKWLSELDFILKGADSIVQLSEKVNKKIFAISALSYQILVSNLQQIMEFAKAGEDAMSFRAAMNELLTPVSKQRLFFKHTMFGFELNDVDPHDKIPRRVAKGQSWKKGLRRSVPDWGATASRTERKV